MMKKILIVFIIGTALLLTACRGSNNTTTLDVYGMTCGACESRLRTALEEVGVTVVSVSAVDNNVVFEFDENNMTLADIQIAIVDAGFTLSRSNLAR